MMERFTEEYAILATIDPTGDSTGASTSDTIDCAELNEVVFILATETMAASSTLDLVVQSGTATGTVTTSVTSITQLTAGDDDKQVIVSVLTDNLGAGHRYVNAKVTVAAGNGQYALIGLGRRRYAPANEHDLATVDEIINA